METRVERRFRGISKRLARRYLTNLGGEPRSEDTVEGDGWRATISAQSVSIGRSLTLTEVTIVFEGDEDRLESILPAFAQKAMRAGG